MIRIQKITALLCALALAASSFGAYADNARAAGLPVTSDDAPLFQETMERGATKNIGAKTNAQKLEPGKKAQGRLVTGDDGQEYQITLKSSGQLDIRLEGETGKLAACLTDKDGKGWAPRRKTSDGKQTYQLKKGTYYCQVQAIKGAAMPNTGLDYAVTATFRSAKAKFEDNNTRKKAAKLPLKKIFYGHLASNAPTEYYKVTLKRISCLSFSVHTQMMDKEPETFVVTLYNKDGKRMTDWENPDWAEYEKETDDEGIWMWDDDGDRQGLQVILEAGNYYVGVSVKRNENGKVPPTARYGQYAVCADVSGIGVALKLSSRQAEYTGKKIAPPGISMKDYPQDPDYDFWGPCKVEDFVNQIWSMQTNEPVKNMRKIGRYRMGYHNSIPGYHPGRTYAYAIFTVTPIRGKISRVSSKKKGQVQVSVKKNAQSTGCQIQIARDKKFKKSVKTLKAAGTRKTIKGLSHGKKYYIRVRNYKDVKTYYCDIAVPESIYGKWSKVKAVVCK